MARCLMTSLVVFVAAAARMADNDLEDSDLLGAEQVMAGAANQPTGAFKHTRLTSYHATELEAAENEDELMLLIQRDLQRILRLRDVDPHAFKSLFPLDFSTQATVKTTVKNTLSMAVTTVGLFDLQGYLAIARAASGYTFYGITGAMSAGDYVKSLGSQNKQLAALGGPVKTDYWADVPLGQLFEAYYKVRLAQRSYLSSVPVLTEDAELGRSGCDGPFGQGLPKGTLLKVLKAGTACTKVSVKADQNQLGFVPTKSTATRAWYINKGTFLPILDNRDANIQTGEFVLEGDTFTVIDKTTGAGGELWKLGDGRGLIEVNTQLLSSLEGPLTQEKLDELEGVVQQTLNPEATGTENDKVLGDTSEFLDSQAMLIGRVCLHGGLALGTIFSGGLLAPVQAAFSVADAATTMGVELGKSATVMEKVAFLMAGLARFEMKLFSKDGGYTTCDLRKENPCGDPKNAQVCLRSGVFQRVGHDESRAHGVCVKAVRPLLPLQAGCVVDTDCASGFCKMPPIQISLLEASPAATAASPDPALLLGTCQRLER
mmetsp:Transcript_62612/g.189007  ORF Transcript_62612/g.189007 Transcript_62612/m.189007 type:complete len:545 (+) Transcript_62612:50-1684(+)